MQPDNNPKDDKNPISETDVPRSCIRTTEGDVHCGVVVEPPAPVVEPVPLGPKDVED